MTVQLLSEDAHDRKQVSGERGSRKDRQWNNGNLAAETITCLRFHRTPFTGTYGFTLHAELPVMDMIDEGR
jgi:hypothetical protein